MFQRDKEEFDIEEILNESVRDEPRWREDADKYNSYYDSNQLTSEILVNMKNLGIAPSVRNLIGPAIDSLIGLWVKIKRDLKVAADTEEFIDLADAMTQLLRDGERSSKFDDAVKRAFTATCKSGVGWLEVQDERDPFRPPYRVKDIHRDEMHWDWRGDPHDTTTWRYCVRRRWFDKDMIKVIFPKKHELIDQVGARWANWDLERAFGQMKFLNADLERERRALMDEETWRDSTRQRLCLYEVWYRIHENGHVLRLPDGRIIEYKPKNVIHNALVTAGVVSPEATFLSRVRLAWWIGPHKLYDIPTPYPHNRFPYVPMWSYIEDKTGIPYSPIRRMISPQDSVNARHSKMLWLLSAKSLTMDDDQTEGTMTIGQLKNQIARPNAMFILNSNRDKNGIFKLDADRAMAREQYNVMKDDEAMIDQTSGINAALIGRETGAKSGVALANLVEQATSTLAPLLDNANEAKMNAGYLLMSLVRRDVNEQSLMVHIERNGVEIPVPINQPSELYDPDSPFQYRHNDINFLKNNLVLEETPSTPAYRNLIMTQMSEVLKSLPGDAQMALMEFFFLSTDLPQRKEMARAIKEFRNPPQPDPSQVQAQQQQLQLELAEKQATIDKMSQEIEESKAKTGDILAALQKKVAETEKIHEEIDSGAIGPRPVQQRSNGSS